jgi:hypothetical protein
MKEEMLDPTRYRTFFWKSLWTSPKWGCVTNEFQSYTTLMVRRLQLSSLPWHLRLNCLWSCNKILKAQNIVVTTDIMGFSFVYLKILQWFLLTMTNLVQVNKTAIRSRSCTHPPTRLQCVWTTNATRVISWLEAIKRCLFQVHEYTSIYF